MLKDLHRQDNQLYLNLTGLKEMHDTNVIYLILSGTYNHNICKKTKVNK